MRLAGICFTLGGKKLAEDILPRLEGWEAELFQGFGKHKVDLHEWTKAMFLTADALLFIGAAGIAVRAVAPYLQSKLKDPAVVVMDETGQYAVPMLSGHVGGANRLARQLAALTEGEAVITTATDLNGLWAVDEWAARHSLIIANPARIQRVSSKLLAGETVSFYSDAPLTGEPPKGVLLIPEPDNADIILSAFSQSSHGALHLIPPCVAVGIGCRKDAEQRAIEEAFQQGACQVGISLQAVCGVYSIDRKKDEPGLLAFCSAHGWPLVTYSAAVLQEVAGSSSPSAFVKRTTGVDNVCERSALAEGGSLLLPKQTKNGVAIAFAIGEISYDLGGPL